MTCRTIDAMVGAEIFFKPENLQKCGAFKARGATNAVLSLTDVEAEAGVVTHSSGNHGQAVAYASSIRGIQSTIVMPDHAPSVKVDAVRGYGADVVKVPHADRDAAVEELIRERGMTLVHPFNDPNVIAGQGTAAAELVEDAPDLDILLAPIGGGGLLSGTAIVAESVGIDVVGAEPELVDDAYRSLRDGVLHPGTGELSVGDGLLTGMGPLPFTILSALDTEVVVVSDAEMLDAMRLFATRMKIVVEPSAATVLAAMLRYRDRFCGQRIGAIISGGNVSLDLFGGAAD